MFRLVQKGLRLSHCTPSSAGCQCAPVVRTVASGSLMDAFRQRKPIEGRVTTRSYTVGADKLDKPQSNIQLAVGSSKKRNAVEISDAAPQKPSQKHGRKAPARKSTAGDAPPENAAVDNPQPKAITSPIRKPAAAKRQSRRTAKPAMQPSADVAERRTTGDVEIAVSSSEASTATASASIQAAPSGLPAAIPSGLPADPAVLHCWTKESMAEAATYLADKDPALAPLIAQHGVPSSLLAKGFQDMFNSLALSILGQQLAVKAAKVITGRFMALCQCEDKVTSEAVLAVTQEQLRAVGLSNAKARYVLDLASHFQSGELSDAKIAVMDDETLVAELTKVKGIGQWTVDMFAMFHLGRPDIFPLGDLAVRKGLIHLYSLKAKPTVAEMDVVGDVWAPYRSLGSYYMWRLPIHQKVARKKAASTAEASDVVPGVGAVPNIA